MIIGMFTHGFSGGALFVSLDERCPKLHASGFPNFNPALRGIKFQISLPSYKGTYSF